MSEHETEEEIVTLRYNCPIYVDVNLTTGEIDRVSIGDALMDYGDCEAIDDVTPEQEARAKAVAEEADWPAWQFD